MVWRTELADPLSDTPEIWDLRPELDAVLLGSDHSGALWLLALSTGAIRGRWVPTEDAKLAATLFPQGLEKVLQSCWCLKEGEPGPVPPSYLEKIRSSGMEQFLKADLIHLRSAKVLDQGKAVAIIGGRPGYGPPAAQGALECPQPFRVVVVDLRTATALTVTPVRQLFPETVRSHPSLDPQHSWPPPQMAPGRGSMVLCMGGSLYAELSQEALR